MLNIQVKVDSSNRYFSKLKLIEFYPRLEYVTNDIEWIVRDIKVQKFIYIVFRVFEC